MATQVQTNNSPLQAIRYASLSDIGRKREENQDSLGIIENEVFRFFVVADGMGGVKGGAIASSLAISVLKECLETKRKLESKDLLDAIQHANGEIFERGGTDPELAGMGTTMVGLAFVETKMFVVNVGDSRAYRIRHKEIQRLTEDHTLVMELLRSGTISSDQAQNHPVSHMLTRSLGPTQEVEIDCTLSTDGPARGDIYLLCSDGLYNLVTDEEILAVVEANPIESVVEILIHLANQRGGTDNITVIVVEMTEEFPRDVDEVTVVEKPKTKIKQLSNGSAGPAEISGEEASRHQESDQRQTKRAAISSTMMNVALVLLAFFAGITVTVLVSQSRSGNDYLRLASDSRVSVANPNSFPPLPPEVSLPVEVAAPKVQQGGELAATSGTLPNSLPELNQKNPAAQELSNVARRKAQLQALIADLDDKVASFEKPMGEDFAIKLQASTSKKEDLQGKLDEVRERLDTETRKLAVWYGRRKRLLDTDPINLASEVAVSSKAVQERQESFENATWAYLKAHEILRYNPSDKEQAKRVADLVRLRKQRLSELATEVQKAIELSVSETDNRIAELTLQRDQLESDLRAQERNLAYMRVITGRDPKDREDRRQELIHERELAVAESEELKRYFPD